MKPLALLTALSLPLVAADSVVTINEINYNPAGIADSQEWLELYNQMSINVDLSGWRLSGGVDFTIPNGTTIPGGGYLIIARDLTNPALNGLSLVGPFEGSLSNGGETIRLRSSSNRIMDEVEYADSGEWPIAPDGSGATLAKTNASLISDQSYSWAASSQIGGTPGAVNFPQASALTSHIFVPDDALWSIDDSGDTPPINWNSTNFNDAQWPTGQTVIGTDGGQGGVTLTVTDHLVERFRASDLNLNNGAAVLTWPDTATADGVAQDATSTNPPTFATNATPSGQPAVRFSGDSFLSSSISPNISGTSGFVYFAVVKANSPPSAGGVGNGNGTYIWDRNVADSIFPLASLKSDGGRFGLQRRHDNNSGLGGPVSSTPISTSEYQIVAIRRNRSANQFEIWVDGVQEGAQNDNGSSLIPEPIMIGNHATPTVSEGFNGDIAELLVFSDELTDDEFSSVGAYLETRYGVDTAFPGAGVTTPIAANGSTTYLRQSFTFDGTPDDTSVRLNHFIADGAVLYLNGEEIQRVNMPAGPISHNTKALSDVPEPVNSGFSTIPTTALRNGQNTLAVSLHPAAGNTSSFFAASLQGTEIHPVTNSVSEIGFNEVSPAGSADFFIELVNLSPSTLNTDGYTLMIDGETSSSIALPNASLEPGGLLLLDQATLGIIPARSDKLFLASPSGDRILDAREVTNRLRGISSAYPDQWLFPNNPTPGLPNFFTLNTDIVINEICYNPPILDGIPAIPATLETTSLIGPNSAWRFNQSGEALPSDWATQAHPVGGNWELANSPLAYDSDLGVTNLRNPRDNSPSVITYYFERDFTLTAEQAAGLSSMTIDRRFDDGAIVYLNGIEIHRFQIASTSVNSRTLASPAVGNAEWNRGIILPIEAGSAVAGLNRISVEVHQSASTSSDVYFDFEARIETVLSPGVPRTPPRGNETQWLELHNRSDQSVDLSNWNFNAGINYNFPAGTTLPAGGYLVIANDPATLAAQHPGITILGPFGGSLSRRSETITLRDQNNNTVDSLRYFDGGRWPSNADAGGSTMELTDPDADNSRPAAWANSDELSRTSWQNYSFRGVAAPSPVGADSQWREFVFGMLEKGEILIDDITVIEDPDGARVPMISDGSFENGNLNTWRLRGTHRHANIIPDPDGGGNVLHLRASNSTEHMHNNIETTLRNNETVTNGLVYEISFRARWLSGNHLLNTRLYFNRVPHTFVLERPDILGTPGTANSTLVSNEGPTSESLTHFPVVPAAGEPTTISVDVTDPDGVASITLHYRVEGGSFSTTPMTPAGASSTWQGTIPGQSAGDVVQFYLTATDSLGASNLIPAAGPDSRALYQVQDGRAVDSPCINNFRIIMDPNDVIFFETPRNLMSNDRIPCTLIDREGTIYYNVGVRIKGSQRARSSDTRFGFNVGFSSEQLFRNVHRSVAIDRSEGQVVGQRELLFDIMATSTGGVPGEFNDLAYVISPNPNHTGPAILQLARFGSVFLEDQFEDGSDGTVYEYELVYYPLTTDAGGYKVPQPDVVLARRIDDIGDDPESYRWTYLIKNNQEFDNFDPAITLGKQFSMSDADFAASVADVLDVDQWLRALAYSCATGAGDTFYSNSRHNGQFYGRPDGKILYFPHDHDFAFRTDRSIFQNDELNRIIANPSFRRDYLAHLYEICTSVYNRSWMETWTDHFDDCIPGPAVFSDDLTFVDQRSNFILSEINASIPNVNFAITTNGGNDFTTNDSPVLLSGNGWIDIEEIRLSNGTSLDLTWTSTDAWELNLALGQGVHPITLEAYDSQGNLLASDSITITRTGGPQTPEMANLVISEIYYNPPGSGDATEFIELLNVGTAPLDLSGSSFTAGIEFTFPQGTILEPGERILVVSNEVAFIEAYGEGLNIAGEFENGSGLRNSGELITLQGNSGNIIQSFTYSDSTPWPTEADGDGYSLILIAPDSVPDHGLASSWRTSAQTGGNPGTSDACVKFDGVANADEDGDGIPALIEHLLGTSDNDSTTSGNHFGVSDLVASGADFPTFEVTYIIGKDDVVASAHHSTDLDAWSGLAADIVIQSHTLNGDGTATTIWQSTKTLDEEPRQFFRINATLR